MEIHGEILQAINEAKKRKSKKKKEESVDKNKPREFEISKLYNYLKAYITAKFKVSGIKLKELKLGEDYFYVVISAGKDKFDPNFIINEIRGAVSKKFEISGNDITVVVTEDIGKENILILSIEYKKKEG